MALSEVLTLNDVRSLVGNIEDNLRPTEGDSRVIEGIFLAARMVVDRMNVIAPNPEQKRTGGVLVVAVGGDVPFVVADIVGTVDIQNPNAEKELDRDKINKYAVHALGKVAIVIQNPGFISSRENVNLPPNQQLNAEGNLIPGGAIRIGDKVVCFSGYSFADDESMVLATCVLAGEISKEQSLEIAQQLGNMRYGEIVNQLITPEEV